MACIASTFTGSVAALKASKVQVRVATRERARTRRAEVGVFPRFTTKRDSSLDG
jgi:hypothetical protein